MTARRCLVTGAAGQDGRLLVAALRAGGDAVLGIDLRQPDDLPDLALGDVRDRHATRSIVESFQPDEIYHLAAMSDLGDCERDPDGALRANVAGTLNVLDAARERGDRCRTLVVTSSEIFGEAAGANHNHPRAPVSVYGLTKLAAEAFALGYRELHGLWVSTVIPFPHLDPASGRMNVLLRMARAFARAERDRAPVAWDHSNAQVVREWQFAQVYVDAMIRALRHPVTIDLVLASGLPVSLRDVFARMTAHFMNAYQVSAPSPAPESGRPVSPRASYGDPALACDLGVLLAPDSPRPPIEYLVAAYAAKARAEIAP